MKTSAEVANLRIGYDNSPGYVRRWNRMARPLLGLRETWESTNMEERKDLIHFMIHEAGVDIVDNWNLWMITRSD